jgi:hypothetical protein
LKADRSFGPGIIVFDAFHGNASTTYDAPTIYAFVEKWNKPAVSLSTAGLSFDEKREI